MPRDSVVISSLALLCLQAMPALAQTRRTPVVVELFTSEGCSSCPPADQFLTRLQREQPIPGVEIIALGEHVDYWNRLGWRDPYSSAEFTARQQRYSQVFGNDGAYTPQMVVDGRAEFVGSDAGRARLAIETAARLAKVDVQLARAPKSAPTPDQIALQVRVESLPAGSAGSAADVLLAITEDNLATNVSRGENAGRKLSHTGVVRKLSVIGKVNPRQTPAFSAQPGVAIDNVWKRENLRAVVLVQERASGRVLGAAAVPLAE